MDVSAKPGLYRRAPPPRSAARVFASACYAASWPLPPWSLHWWPEARLRAAPRAGFALLITLRLSPEHAALPVRRTATRRAAADCIGGFPLPTDGTDLWTAARRTSERLD